MMGDIALVVVQQLRYGMTPDVDHQATVRHEALGHVGSLAGIETPQSSHRVSAVIERPPPWNDGTAAGSCQA